MGIRFSLTGLLAVPFAPIHFALPAPAQSRRSCQITTFYDSAQRGKVVGMRIAAAGDGGRLTGHASPFFATRSVPLDGTASDGAQE